MFGEGGEERGMRSRHVSLKPKRNDEKGGLFIGKGSALAGSREFTNAGKIEIRSARKRKKKKRGIFTNKSTSIKKKKIDMPRGEPVLGKKAHSS